MSALWLLFRIRTRAELRKLKRGLNSKRGLVLAVLTLGFFATVLLPNLLFWFQGFKGEAIFAERMTVMGPFVLLVIILTNLVTSAGERAIYFSPSEVDFLFTAPFSRRELLIYKLAGVTASLVALGLFMAVAMAFQFFSLLFAYIGIVLGMCFIVFTGMAITMIGQTMVESAFNLTRQLIGYGIILVFVAIAIYAATKIPVLDDPMGWMESILASQVGSILLAPCSVFVETVFSETWAQFLPRCAICTAIVAGLLVVIIGLDANYLETASNVSQKVYEQLQRFNAGQTVKASKPALGLRLPMLPYMNGVGPLAWRQLVTGARTCRALLAVGVLIISLLCIPIVMKLPEFSRGPRLVGIASGVLAYLTVIFSLNLPMGFRAEVSKIEVLKALPFPAFSIAAGQLAGPVVVVTGFQWLALAFIVLLSQYFSWYWLFTAAFFPIINIVVFSLANILFLLYPVRFQAGSKDLQAVGLTMMFMLIQGLVLVVVFGAISTVGGIVYYLTESVPFALLVVWVGLFVLSIVGIVVTGIAFERYDVGSTRL